MMKVLLVNPADKLRKEVKVLVDKLSEFEQYDLTVLTTQEIEKEDYVCESCNSVSYVQFDSWYVPNVRYTIPSLDFVKKLNKLVGQSDMVIAASCIYLPSVLANSLARYHHKKSLVIVDALPGINWSYGNSLVDYVGKVFMRTVGLFGLKAADRVVILGDYLRDDLSNVINEGKIVTIPNGIDTDKYHIDQSESTSNKTTVLYVGRLDPVKNIPVLLLSMRNIRQKLKSPVELILIGDGSQRSNYEKIAKNLGIDDIVQFLGWQDNVEDYYSIGDLLVLPSISEGQPSVIMEAQASGLPIVASDVGGINSLIKEGKTVPPNKETDLTTAMVEMITSGQLAPSYDSREYVVENFSQESMVKSYRQLFDDLIGEE